MTAEQLAALARDAGIQSEYRATGSGELRSASDRTRSQLLRALGLDPQDAAAPAALAAWRRAQPARSARAAGGRCVDAAQHLGPKGGFGIWANLYSLRGEGGLGVGSLSDLAAVVDLAADAGAAFVGTSPLHAVRNRPPDVSPYQPLSRLFGNPLYLDPTRAPEWERSPEARGLLAAGPEAAALQRLREGRRIDYEGAAQLHDRLARRLHARFREQRAERPGARERAYDDFCREAGEPLRDFATFCAIEARLRAEGRPTDWRRWPAGLRGPRLPAVERFREEHPEEVDYHRFLQFELDRQLAAVAERARSAGLALGLYTDLAVGSAAAGFDTWALGEHFVDAASVGAPPDDYTAEGQDWGLPPLHPWKLADDDYRVFRLLLRASLAHAGMLRIDHILGLVRQYWIPAGEPAAAGAYVGFPARELLAVVAEESQRAGAVVVGEDLGTVPPGLPALLARHRVLSSRVLVFERDRRGGFRAARRYSRRALCTANTHDLPSLPAFLAGSDLELRHDLGLLDGAELASARAERDAARRALLRRLSADGALPAGPGGAGPGYPELCAAVHRFLCATPAPLVGIALDDLAAETEPVNLPGVAPEVYPSWTRRMQRPVQALARDPEVTRMLEGARARAALRP